MPRVYLSENDRLTARLVSWIYGEMKSQGITQRRLADEMEITQQALSWKLKNNAFTFADFLTIIRILEPDDKDLVKLLGR